VRCTLVKFTILAAFEDGEVPQLEDLGDRLAEVVRYEAGTLTAAAEYESVQAQVDNDDPDDALGDALATQFPSDTLPVGPTPGVKVLGRNGTFKQARLTRKEHRIELWLGTAKERYPLVSFPAGDDGKES
jgi:hypothetical protein